MQKIIEVCTRVEGHGAVNIFIQNNEISHVEFKISAFRGFENILNGKKIFDVPKIVSRICGLCHASQSIVSCKAIEDMYNIRPNQQAVLIRRLLMTGELLKSHAMHFFFQSIPDLIEIFNLHQKPLSLYKLLRYDPQLTTNIYDLIKIGTDIDRLFGGRSIHLITTIPGGIIFKPIKKNIKLAKKYFQKALSILEVILDQFINQFSSLSPPEEYSLSNLNFLALNNNKNYDRYEGNLTIKKGTTKYCDFLVRDYSKYFDKDSTLHGINFIGEKNKNFLVGPISRNEIIESYGLDQIYVYFDYFNKTWKNSLLYANYLQLIEMYTEVNKSLELLDNPIIKTNLPLPALNTIKNQNGIGVVEAPRGTLLHHYRVNKRNIIEEAKLFIATEINIPIINEMITKYAQKLYEKEDINQIKIKVQKIIRAFDPCISCATH